MVKGKKIPVFCMAIITMLSAMVSLSIAGADLGVRGNPPILSNYSVSPSTGDDSTSFSFSIIYTDYDNDMPFNMDVVIDNNWNKMMTNDTNASRGMFYSYTTKLSTGNHTYYFTTTSMANETTRNPSSGIYYFYVGSSGTGKLPKLNNHTVSPERPLDNQTIEFQVQYQDQDNDKPDYVRLFIKKSDTNNSYKQINMNVKGSTYSSGVFCLVSINLTEGSYYYYFKTSSKNNTVMDPPQEYYKLYVANSSQQNTNPKLMYGSVSPLTGTTNTMFKYTVVYQDGYFGGAKISWVVIDNKSYLMKESTGDSGSAGVYYEYSTKLSQGNHTYYFQFSDGKTYVTLPVNSTYTGPYVSGPSSNRAPTASIFVNPTKGDLNTTFYFNGTATDPDGDILTYDWLFSDGYNVSGKQYLIRTFKKTGNYTVTLYVSDGDIEVKATAQFAVTPISTNPPGRNNPPVIITNLKSFNTVKINTTMYISALGTYDPDGDPITYKWSIIGPQSNLPASYNIKSFNYTFKMAGNYSIKLEVSDSQVTSTGKYSVYCTDTTQKSNPVARATVSVKQMVAMLYGGGSYDPDGNIVSYAWTIDRLTFKGMYYNHTYKTTGYKTVTLTVTDNDVLTGKTIVGFYISGQSNKSKDDNRDYNNSRIGSHVIIEDGGMTDAKLTTLSSEPDFDVSIIESDRNYLKLEVNSDSDTGKLIVVDIQNIFDSEVLDLLEIRMDDDLIELTDLNNIIMTTGDKPLYFIVLGEDVCQFLLYIPHFSKHTVEIKVQSDDKDPYNPEYGQITANIWTISGIFAVVIVVAVIIIFFQIRKKKEINYYHDFRVAEEKANNGQRAKQDEEHSVDWDEFI